MSNIHAVLGWLTRAGNAVVLILLLAMFPLFVVAGGSAALIWPPLLILFFFLTTSGDWRRYGAVRLVLNLPIAFALIGGMSFGLWKMKSPMRSVTTVYPVVHLSENEAMAHGLAVTDDHKFFIAHVGEQKLTIDRDYVASTSGANGPLGLVADVHTLQPTMQSLAKDQLYIRLATLRPETNNPQPIPERDFDLIQIGPAGNGMEHFRPGAEAGTKSIFCIKLDGATDCTQRLVHRGLDISLTYPRSELGHWKVFETGLTALIDRWANPNQAL